MTTQTSTPGSASPEAVVPSCSPRNLDDFGLFIACLIWPPVGAFIWWLVL